MPNDQITIFTTNDAIGAAPMPGEYVFGSKAVFALLNQARPNHSFKISVVPSGDDTTRCNVKALIASLTESENHRLVVVTDTDTLLDTSKELKTVSNKTVVVTGAWRPGPYPDGDAAINLGMAIAAAQLLEEAGVFVAINGFVGRVGAVRLNDAKDRFELAEKR